MNYDEMKTGENNTINTNYEYHRSETQKLPTATIAEKEKSSFLFLVSTIVTGIVGFIVGIVYGNTFPAIEYEYEYAVIQKGDLIPVETFNWPVTFGTWIVFALAALGFWAIYCHLANQEETIKELKMLNSKIKSE